MNATPAAIFSVDSATNLDTTPPATTAINVDATSAPAAARNTPPLLTFESVAKSIVAS